MRLSFPDRNRDRRGSDTGETTNGGSRCNPRTSPRDRPMSDEIPLGSEEKRRGQGGPHPSSWGFLSSQVRLTDEAGGTVSPVVHPSRDSRFAEWSTGSDAVVSPVVTPQGSWEESVPDSHPRVLSGTSRPSQTLGGSSVTRGKVRVGRSRRLRPRTSPSPSSTGVGEGRGAGGGSGLWGCFGRGVYHEVPKSLRHFDKELLKEGSPDSLCGDSVVTTRVTIHPLDPSARRGLDDGGRV